VTEECPTAVIMLAGDFNMLDDQDVATRCTLQSIVNRSTRSPNTLDRIYVNEPCYTSIRVVTSTVKSDHKAVIAYAGSAHLQPLNKRNYPCKFRRWSPTQHASFLLYASQLNIEFVHGCDVHTNFDILYALMIDLLDRYYPERVITVTSSDPPYVTPAVKAMLRRKNRLMHAGRTDEAGRIAARIRTIILARVLNGCVKWIPESASKMPGPKSERSFLAQARIAYISAWKTVLYLPRGKVSFKLVV